MRSRLNKLWPFTKKAQITSTPKQEKPSPEDSLSWSLYQHINEMPLSRWMDLIVDGYSGAVVKSGNPPEHEIAKAENELRIQYADAIGDAEYRMYVNAIKEVASLEMTLSQIHNLVRALADTYVPQFVKALNKLLHSNLVFDVTKPQEYDESLQRAIRRSAGLKIRRDLKQAALVKMEEKYNGTGKVSREYYLGVLISLSNDAGFRMNENDITVWEFCERIKRLNRKNEMLNARK